MNTSKSILTLALVFFLTSIIFANNNDKISAMTRDVIVEPTKTGATVTLDMYFKHPENIKEMTIERGTILGESFRQVKVFGSSEIASIVDGKMTTIDKYPISGKDSDIYYRVVIVDKDGVVRFFPASSMQNTYSASAE